MKSGITGFLAVSVVVLVLGIVAGGTEVLVFRASGLPANWENQIVTHTGSGDSELSIDAFWCTSESLTLAWHLDSYGASGWYVEARRQEMRTLMALVTAKWPGRHVLQLTITPEQQGHFYWWPLRLVVTQYGHQYNAGPDDFMTYDDAFCGGLLYETATGWLALPAEVNIYQPFDLWYGADSMTLGPFIK